MTAVAAPRAHRRAMSALALGCVILQFPGALAWSALALALWLAALAAADGAALRRLWMPRFWGLTLVFAALAGLLLGPRAQAGTGAWVSLQGVEAGLLMTTRGGFLFGLATWASRAFGGEDVRRAFATFGAGKLGVAFATALQVLPELVSHLRAAATEPGGRRPSRVLEGAVRLVVETERIAERIAAQAARPRRIAVIGPPGAGKTSALAAALQAASQAGLRVGGVLQPAIEREERRVGYRLRDAATGEERAFAEEKAAPTPGSMRFAFDPAAWVWAAERIRAARASADVLVVDELGRLEAKGEGHLPALLETIAQERAVTWILAVRADQLAALRERLGGLDEEIALDAPDAADRLRVALINGAAGTSGAAASPA